MTELQKLFVDVTGLTWDVQSLIDTAVAAGSDAKNALLKKLVWLIPDGAAADLKDRQALPEKSDRIKLVNAISTALGFDSADLSQVFVDVNEDGDVDAYDAVTVDDSYDSSSDSGSDSSSDE